MLVVVVPLYLVEKNIPIPIITLVIAIGVIPWALKFIWGSIADIYQKYGRRKFTIIGTIIGSISFIILALIDQYFSIIFFTLFLFIGHVGISFLDVSADAWVIDITKKEERGKLNASMNTGKAISNSLFSPVIVITAITFGYNISFLLMGIIILFIAFFPIISKDIKMKIKNEKIWYLMKNEFKIKSTRLSTLYFFSTTLNPGILVALIVIYAKTVLNLDDFTIGLIGAILLVSIVPGSYVGGFLADKYGRKKTSMLFLLLTMITPLVFILTTDLLPTIILLGILDFVWNGMFPSNVSLLMDIINPKIAASEFSLISSCANIGGLISSSIAGTLVILIGFQNIFILSSLLVIPPIIILYNLNIQK